MDTAWSGDLGTSVTIRTWELIIPAILNLAKMRPKYHKIMISANVISTGYGILESIKIHIENCCNYS